MDLLRRSRRRRQTRQFRLVFGVDAANVAVLTVLAARGTLGSRGELSGADLAATVATPAIAAGGLVLAARALRFISSAERCRAGAARANVLVGGIFNAIASLAVIAACRGSSRRALQRARASATYLLWGATAITAVYLAILPSEAKRANASGTDRALRR